MKKASDYITDHGMDGVVIPEWLFSENPYKNLSNDARLVYALLLTEKYKFSATRNWYVVVGQKLVFDNSLELVRYMLACGKRTAQRVITELTKAELIIAV